MESDRMIACAGTNCRYVYRRALLAPWTKTKHMTCADDELLLLPNGWQPNTYDECQTAAETNGSCASAPTRTVVYAAPDETNTSCWTKTGGMACTDILYLSQQLSGPPGAVKCP
jgi:hypothetical protein